MFAASLAVCALHAAPAVAQEAGLRAIVAREGSSAIVKPVDVRSIVDGVVRPLMKRYGIPGMAIGVTTRGRHYVFNYGVASKATRKPVDDDTLFEIGSISKTFTASLVSYAQVTGKLSLSDDVAADVPSLRGTSFDRVRLVNLGTHTAGGLPLQFPGDVRTDADAMRYYRHWKPSHIAGTYRLYSNTSIMLLGAIAANRMHADFSTLMQHDILATLGLHDTFLVIPRSRLGDYAQGYTAADAPKRMTRGPLWAQAYGIRTSAPDMLRFVDANLNGIALDDTLRRAIAQTHRGYYAVGAMTQDLMWEQYDDPVSLATLLQGNSARMIFDDHRVRAIDPPSPPRKDVWIDKTGSTNGFSAYVAFVPKTSLGIVLLANKSYPIEARVTTAYRILTRLTEAPSAGRAGSYPAARESHVDG